MELTRVLVQIFMVWWDREFKACMVLLKAVGNRIHKSIQIEVDYPLRHEDNLKPILDLNVWVDRENVIMDGKDCTVNVVLHEFYVKEVLSKMMLSSSLHYL